MRIRDLRVGVVCLLAFSGAAPLWALPADDAASEPVPARAETLRAQPKTDRAGAPPKSASGSSTESVSGAAARRNENVQVNRIDTDSLKEANIRLGVNVTIVPLAAVDTNYYTTEHGRPPGERVFARPSPISGWHGEAFEYLQNSVFNARTFFQAGPVLPSRQNNFGARFGGNLGWLGTLSGGFSDRKIRGMVNGNVLVPLPNERTPLVKDPAARALIALFLSKYPRALPNRPDFDPRMLNTNSPQRVDELDGTLRLDRIVGQRGRLILSHSINRQDVHAFELVAGQNPDQELHGHRSNITYLYTPSANTDAQFAMGFARVHSYLHPEPNAAPMRVRMGYQFEELGPDGQFPIDRAQNSFRWGAAVTHRMDGGRHTLIYGGDLIRFQLNGIETNNYRGYYNFTNNFGRSAIQNLLLGTPSGYEVSIGPMERGFRNRSGNAYVADAWKVTPQLQIYYGVRYNFVTAPVEVNHLNRIPYGCDCNNFSPRFSIAWKFRSEWVLRTSYTVSFGEVMPVTYAQVRYDPPLSHYIQVQNPSLLHPLSGVNLSDPNLRTALWLLSPDLVSPYAHQYNFSVERALAKNTSLRFGYVGSRSYKLLNYFVENRARPVPGIPLTVDTIDLRRPDQRYYEVTHILNGGIAYLDAAQVSVESRYRAGLAWSATYTFGKALDQGADYASTAANRDLSRGRAQSEFDAFKDKKGLSNFDSTHALLMSWSYDLPLAHGAHGFTAAVAHGWQISGSSLVKSGTPFTLYVGSDSPGFGNVDGSPSERPNILDASILGRTVGNPDTAPLILARDRFAYITRGALRGNLGRNTFRKGGIANVNAALMREWRWGGGGERALQFRTEAFNLTNHPQFDEPQRNLSSPSFGRITNTLNDGRIFQLGLRVLL